jgi:probable HAF family extracellular repeat protein
MLTNRTTFGVLFVLAATLALTMGAFAGPAWAAPAAQAAGVEGAPPAGYVAIFVSTAATGVGINASGDVIGTSYPDPGCGSFCLPTLETVVWRGAQRIVLPSVPGLTGITVRSINAQGWVAGLAGVPGTTTHAVVWKPNGNSYVAIDLGTLPGTTVSEAVGIDDSGRVVGWSTTLNFPPNGSPFMWTESGGMVDLSALGFPDEAPLAISPGGAVATPGYWYQLGNPNSVAAMAAPPRGFYPPGNYGTAINDVGDQARFLVTTGGQNLAYLFRYHSEGVWQQISFTGNGHLTPWGVGSINAAGDVSATVLGNGVIAYGPDGLTQPLLNLLSPSYQASGLTVGGPMNGNGEILAQVIIGQSRRLMRLTPGQACTSGCIRVTTLVVRARFVQDPQNPGQCAPGLKAYNTASVSLKVKSETGAPLQGVVVSGRFLDDYWTNKPISGTTNSQGILSFKYRGPCGVGAIAFLVDSAAKAPLAFDKTVGVLSGWAIPQ